MMDVNQAPLKNNGIWCIGDVHDPDARPIRIVHISDTHEHHSDLLSAIPDGDILIHSGDFGQLSLSQFLFRSYDYYQEVKEINSFFGKLPHAHKIFVAGNHEVNFPHHSVERTQSLIKNGVYLQDSAITLLGIKFYGCPWNGLRKSHARGFSVPYNDLAPFWENIPDNTDVLVTHNPPLKILDHGLHRNDHTQQCHLCHGPHSRYMHLGCGYLRQHIFNRVRPKMHCFGHVHGRNDVVVEDGIVFSNAAMRLKSKAQVIDYYIDPSLCHTDAEPVNFHTPETTDYGGCVLQ